eukprot:378114_1
MLLLHWHNNNQNYQDYNLHYILCKITIYITIKITKITIYTTFCTRSGVQSILVPTDLIDFTVSKYIRKYNNDIFNNSNNTSNSNNTPNSNNNGDTTIPLPIPNNSSNKCVKIIRIWFILYLNYHYHVIFRIHDVFYQYPYSLYTCTYIYIRGMSINHMHAP